MAYWRIAFTSRTGKDYEIRIDGAATGEYLSGAPNPITIAEDTSALPGLGLPIEDGGLGFDYRLAMGEPDMWIRLLKETPDEHWDLGNIYYARPYRPYQSCRRIGRKISYSCLCYSRNAQRNQ